MATNKKYRKGFDELKETPQFVERRDNEFPAELSVEEFIGSEKSAAFKTDRRDFLKFLGFSVAAASLAACEKPVIKSVPYVNKPEEITPGIANWYASTYYDGNDYGSVLIKTREGRPILIKGNKNYGINGVATTPRIIGSVLSLYNEARLQEPHKHGETGCVAVSWSDVDAEISTKLTSIASKGGTIRLVSRSIISPSTKIAINAFSAKYGGNEPFPMGPINEDVQVLDEALPIVDTSDSSEEVSSPDIKHVVLDEVSLELVVIS